MGNAPAAMRRDRRREMTFLLYFVMGFVLIRVWILLIASKNTVVISVGGGLTFLLLISLCIRCRIARPPDENGVDPENLHPDVQNPDLAQLHALYRPPRHGLTQAMIDSLYCFEYNRERDDPAASTSFPRNSKSNAMCGTTATLSDYGCEGGAAGSALHSAIAGEDENDIERNASGENAGCSICLADYSDNETVTELPCGHLYHRNCVTEWLLAHTQCPLCKQDVLLVLEQQQMLQAQILSYIPPIASETTENDNTDSTDQTAAVETDTAPLRDGGDSNAVV